MVEIGIKMMLYTESTGHLYLVLLQLMHLTTGGANQLLLEDGVTMGDQTFT